MFVKQIYTECLSQAAYYVESEGEAAIIDPLRDIRVYLDLARERKAGIRYIFETHVHADFVSGHLDLAAATGAGIVFGPGTVTRLPVTIAADGQRFALGQLTFEVIHTPGHTPESCCYLLRDSDGLPAALFSGDTLLVGGTGKPEITQTASLYSNDELALMLYDSLRQRLMHLPDALPIYPGHGSGTVFGKELGPDTHSTMGEQRKSNPALQPMEPSEFVQWISKNQGVPPSYFSINARINKEGYESMKDLLDNGLTALSVEAFKQNLANGALIVDTRPATRFTSGFIPGSISIGLEGRFGEWAGSLLPFDATLLLVTEPGREEESLIRLARVGFQHFGGYLLDGLDAWRAAGEPTDLIIDVEADELAMDLPFDPHLLVLDVRRETEFADGHIRGALNLPLAELNDPANMSAIEDHHNTYIHCSLGYRSVIAASLLKRQGIHNIRNVLGGWQRIMEQDRDMEIVKEGSVLN